MQSKNYAHQHHQLHETPGTSKLPAPRLTQQQQPAPTTGFGRLRRQRKSNFSNGEVEILVREVASRRDVLFGTRGTRTTTNTNNKGCGGAGGANKMGEWREIAGAVNGAGIGERRTVREVRKKWENVVSSFRRKIRQPNLLTSLIGTGRCPADEALACANAYCGVQQQQPMGYPPQQQQVYDRVSEPPGHKQEDLSSDEPMFIQPEVQLELDDSTMHFGDSSDVCTNKQAAETQRRLTPSQVEDVDESQMDIRQIEQQKLQVMRELLKVETKRLKVEKKRLKVERMRLQIDLQSRMHPSPVSLAAYKT